MPVLITPEKSVYRQLAFPAIPSFRQSRFSREDHPVGTESISWCLNLVEPIWEE